MGKNLIFPILCALFLLLVQGCARKPLVQIPTALYPVFSDDLSYNKLTKAIDQSLILLRKRPSKTLLGIAGTDYTVEQLVRSLLFFRTIIAKSPSPDQLNQLIKTYFDIFQASGLDGYNPERTMLVTGYYQPVFHGSLVPTANYRYPVYGIPNSLVLRHDPLSGKKEIGRLDGGRFLKYWTRSEIKNEGRAAGYELVYLKNPLDAFLLHIQGSGLIKLPDGSTRGLHYAMKNGRQYKSIGKYMVKSNRMTLAESSIDTIRNYLNAHPQEIPEILNYNDSFIFFAWSANHDAVGSLGRPLTSGRSIALDQNKFPAGALIFLRSKKPIVNKGYIDKWESFGRFVLAQDSGSAIRGSGRVDLFCGSGEQAGVIAGQMKEEGTMYILLLKKHFL